MGNTNPKSAIDALFPTPIKCGCGVEVHPLTLGHYALLEKIDSYLVNGGHAPDSIEVILTYYICTHSAKDIMNDFENLKENAFEWAENLPPSVSNEIASAIMKQINAMTKVIPVIGDDGKKKVAGMAS